MFIRKIPAANQESFMAAILFKFWKGYACLLKEKRSDLFFCFEIMEAEVFVTFLIMLMKIS